MFRKKTTENDKTDKTAKIHLTRQFFEASDLQGHFFEKRYGLIAHLRVMCQKLEVTIQAVKL